MTQMIKTINIENNEVQLRKLNLICGVDNKYLNNFIVEITDIKNKEYHKKIDVYRFPECEKHPKKQVEFVKTLLNPYKQIFVLTHSEHIINSLRVLVKEKQLSNTDISIHFFMENGEYQLINIDISGELDIYPIGFMDEWSNQLMRLI